MLLIVSKYLITKGKRGLTVFPFVFVSQQSDKDEVVLMQDERIHFGGFWNIIEFLKWNILGFYLINNRYIRRVFVSRVFITIGFFLDIYFTFIV